MIGRSRVLTILAMTATLAAFASGSGAAIEPTTVVLDDERQPAGISQQLDADGNPVITYWGGPFGAPEMRLIRCLDPGCATTGPIVTVDAAGTFLGETSLQLDSAGRPVIGYQVASGIWDLRLAKCDDAACSDASISTVDALGITGQNVSMALDQLDIPVFAYETRPVSPGLTFLHLARCSDPLCSGPITIERIDEVTRAQFGPSLALDAAGRPVIAYNNNDRDLVVVHCSDESCAATPSSATIASGDDFPVRPALLLDASGNPVVAHQVDNSGGEQGVRVQRCADPNCSAPPTATMIDTTASFQLSLTLTDDDRPVVALKTPISIDDGNLRIATCGDPDCSSVTIADVDGPPNSGYDVSLSLDAGNIPSVAYQANEDGLLLFTRCADSTCITDRDDDGVADTADNCPDVSNTDQLDTDADDIGDACDLDDDGDGQADVDEVSCDSDPLNTNSQSPDGDGDGVPDCVDSDTSTTAPATTTPPPSTVAPTSLVPAPVTLPETGGPNGVITLMAGVVLASGVFATRLARRRAG